MKLVIFPEMLSDDGTYGEYDKELKHFNSNNVTAFLANINNSANVTPIHAMKGFPDSSSHEVDYEFNDIHNSKGVASYLTIEDLLEYDYNRNMVDFNVRSPITHSGTIKTYGELLGDDFLNEISELHDNGVNRIVFYYLTDRTSS